MSVADQACRMPRMQMWNQRCHCVLARHILKKLGGQLQCGTDSGAHSCKLA